MSPPLAQHVWSSPNLAAALARGGAAEPGGAASSSVDAPAEGFAGGADGAGFGGAAPGLGFGGGAARPMPAGGPASAMDRSASVDCMSGAPYWKPAAAGAPLLPPARPTLDLAFATCVASRGSAPQMMGCQRRRK